MSRQVLRRRRRARLAVAAVAAVSTASMFLLVAFHVFAVQTSFQLDRLSTHRAAEQTRYERLRDEVATLSSPPAIARAARHMGMRIPEGVTILHVPVVASRAMIDDGAGSTLRTSWDDAKRSLGTGP